MSNPLTPLLGDLIETPGDTLPSLLTRWDEECAPILTREKISDTTNLYHLLCLASTQMHSTLFTQASTTFQRIYSLASKEDHSSYAFLALLGLSYIYTKQHKLSAAEDVFERLQTKLTPSSDPIDQSVFHYMHAEYFAHNGKYELAEQACLDAFKFIPEERQARHELGLAAVLFDRLGLCAFRKGNLKDALEHYDRAHALASDMKFSIALAMTMRNAGVAQSILKPGISGLRILREALDLSQAIGYAKGMVKTYISLGRAHLSRGDLRDAQYFFEEGLSISEDESNDIYETELFSRLGDIAIAKGDAQLASTYYKQDFELNENREDMRGYAFASRNLGKCYRIMGHYTMAEKHLQKSVSLFTSISDDMNLAFSLIQYALTLLNTQKFSEAEKAIRNAKTILSEHDRRLECAYCDALQSNIHKAEGEHEISYDMLQKSIRVLQGFAPTFYLAYSLKTLALNELDRNDKEAFHYYIRDAIYVARQVRLADIEEECLDILKLEDHERWSEMVQLPLLGIASTDTKAPKEVERTILFADIRGFTNIAEHLSQEQLGRMVNEYFDEMTKVVYRNKGIVNKFIGDAVMALFGSRTSALPNEAVTCAEEMLDYIGRLEQRQRNTLSCSFGVGVGIVTGKVLLGEFGSQQRKDFTAIGRAVNIASRLQSQAEAGEIIICEETQTRLLNQERSAPIPEHVTLKGIPNPVRIYRITAGANICHSHEHEIAQAG